MSLIEELRVAGRVFFDSAPLIYFVENRPKYVSILLPIFEALDAAEIVAVTSPVTWAECIVPPIRTGDAALEEAFTVRIVSGPSAEFQPIGADVARLAPEVRAAHNLSLTDSFQVAVARVSGCPVLLTNDRDLKRVTGVRILVLDEHL